MSPTYKELLEQVGTQIKARKNALLKRTLLITWPFMAIAVIGFLFNKFIDFRGLPYSYQILLMWVGVLIIFSGLVYSIIFTFIFEIEKRIWIDSYFDQKNLSLSQSWKIAKKLFWPAAIFRLKIIFYYYLLPIVVLTVTTTLVIFGLYDVIPNVDVVVIVALLTVLIAIAVYSYYLKIKLRYLWFIFLDNYGRDYSHTFLTSEMKKLNNISKTDTFKKSLLANLGTDSLSGLSRMAIGTISKGMSVFGGEAGKLVGGITGIYGKELARQAANFGNISAQYILYRFARKELYGEEQVVNDSIYLL